MVWLEFFSIDLGRARAMRQCHTCKLGQHKGGKPFLNHAPFFYINLVFDWWLMSKSYGSGKTENGLQSETPPTPLITFNKKLKLRFI